MKKARIGRKERGRRTTAFAFVPKEVLKDAGSDLARVAEEIEEEYKKNWEAVLETIVDARLS
ncbi:MAG: hypothetical protein NC084_12010 [Bacteroides sp.]|nr:hypothetical protein [Eubacterium sp.]MCM1419295.1 hypothetical protein [Roseburia sp.]MCM1463417.1 hypothetical protein [Bacteroides sp.]